MSQMRARMDITLTQDEVRSIAYEYLSNRFPEIPVEIEIANPTHPPEPKWFNPDNLTPEQVGVSEGWRLLAWDEVTADWRGYLDTQGWYNWGKWSDTATVYTRRSTEGPTLRTKHPIGFYKQ